MSYDYKKEFKDLYMPKTVPSIIDVPEMIFIQVDGKGNPNDADGEYQSAVETLYALSWTIKMMPKSGEIPKDYFEYVVPPLEGLWWWLDDRTEFDRTKKSEFHWTSMIRQPDFVNDEVFEKACEIVAKKKPNINLSKARLVKFTEGLCVQCMHIGAFDDEPSTIEAMKIYMAENDYQCDLSDTRRHHEIYISDPRKIDVSKMKTIIRYPVRKD